MPLSAMRRDETVRIINIAAQHRLSYLLMARRVIYSLLALLVGMSSTSQAIEVTDENMPSKRQPILRAVVADAQESAKVSYKIDDHDLHEDLKNMDYQAYRAIRFDAKDSLWHEQNKYEVQFFHPGFLYQQPVTIVTVGEDNKEQLLPFKSESFRYDKNAEHLQGLTDEKSGYAGFRVHYPIKTQSYKDEIAVFLGASYFRLVGKNQVYGISARGLAVDTAVPEGEEFPHFTKFWLVEPGEGEPLTIYARLESPSVAGAYKFVLKPGVDTSMEVTSWLFARKDVQKLGIAPFTSMFLYGENSQNQPDDYRHEVHDSDGVLMITKEGEQVWRPLTNPARLQITSLSDPAPQAFGMLQRDGAFSSYLDAEANYHLRPGLWVKPQTGFNKGRLELVEIPTNSETHDNIVAYWVPDEPFLAGQSRFVKYSLTTVEQNPRESSVAWVVRTRQGGEALPGEETTKGVNSRRFVVDFKKPEGFDLEVDALDLVLHTTNSTVEQAQMLAVNGDKELRVTFLLLPKGKETVDMRLFINHQEQQVSEVWNYVYQPK